MTLITGTKQRRYQILKLKGFLCAAAGSIGSAMAYLIGGWSKDLITLLIFMAADFVTGIVVAFVFKNSKKTESGKLSSKVSFKGIAKKIVILIFVMIAHLLDLYLETGFIRSGVIVGFMVNELISIIENAALMGIVSPVLNEAIDIIKKEEKNE